MRKTVSIVIAALLSLSLSGCFIALATAAGGGAGYIYKDQMDKKDRQDGRTN